ncbi:Rv3235 family protein [Nocardioides donggukensis]|uniref:Uncharacterized protein n=1 Tax=Nocardioides donggukensis TaxID=2774019 RepID=A0A927K9T3_9ACTN|nr:Rv3235 family protein [Nocardioides donggukensis]MBD8870265.1 hypothetical protein [Nocardioides donggukensis]
MTPFHDNVTPLVRDTVADWPPGGPRGPGVPPSVQGTLALDVAPDLGPPYVPEPVPLPGADVVPVPLPVRRDLHRWALQFAQACVEVVGGDRPVSQLVRWTSPEIHQELTYRATVVARAGVHEAGRGRGRRPVVRPQVQNVRTCFVAEGVAEICVRVRYGERNRAVAGRLEIVGGRWQCTALEFG